MKFDIKNKMKMYEPIFEALDLKSTFLNDNMKSIEELFNTGLADRKFSDLFNSKMKLNEQMIIRFLRDDFVLKYGFTLLNEETINNLTNILKDGKCVEVGAGSGFLSYCLQKNGIDVTPVDKFVVNNNYGFEEKFTHIIEEDAVKFIKHNKSDVVIMCWPQMNNFAANILKNMECGQKLLYLGESHGGCCANELFFNLLNEKAILDKSNSKLLNNDSISWPAIHDRWYLYEIK